MTELLALITGLVVGAMLGYHFALDALLRFQGKQGPLDPAVRNAIRAVKGKPQDAKFYPSMTDEEANEQDGDLQAKLKGQIHPSASQLENK